MQDREARRSGILLKEESTLDLEKSGKEKLRGVSGGARVRKSTKKGPSNGGRHLRGKTASLYMLTERVGGNSLSRARFTPVWKRLQSHPNLPIRKGA